jgi:hypothetical protein
VKSGAIVTTNAYDVGKDGKENRILFWLRLDEWDVFEAAMLFIDVNPDSITRRKVWDGLTTLQGAAFHLAFETDPKEKAKIFSVVAQYKGKYDDMCRILHGQDIDCEYPPVASPQYWIQCALAKKITIPWLDFAIESSFYKSETESMKVERSPDIYRTDLLNILNQAANEFFNPRKNLDAKKEEVTEWIINKGKENKVNVSSNVADAMFTIIKPKDHNPKKRLNP